MQGVQHIFAIPTHRQIPDASLDSFFDEVRYARINRGIEMPLVVVDDGVNNTLLLSAAQERNPDIWCVRFGDTDTADLFDAIETRLGATSRKVLHLVRDPRRPNYGNAYNRLYLIAAMFGAQVLHRRDSDTRVQHVEDADGELRPLRPIELELAHIGRTVDGRRVALAGGGYTGASSLDIDHLSADVNLLRRFYRLLSISDEICDKLLAAPKADEAYCGDRLAFNDFRTPHCGNIAIETAFELLPCSPVPYALGTDYFTFNCLSKLDFGRLTHNRDLVHAYTSCRYNTDEKLFLYWKGVAGLVLYQSFYRPQQDRLATEFSNLGLTGDLYRARDAVAQSMRDYRESAPMVRSGPMMLEFLELVGMKTERRMVPVLTQLHSELPALVGQMQSAIDQHLMLIDSWPDIIHAAKAVGSTSALFRMLTERKAPFRPPDLT